MDSHEAEITAVLKARYQETGNRKRRQCTRDRLRF